MDFNTLRKKAKGLELSNGKSVIKVAILANHASQFLAKALEYQGVINELNLEIYEADFDQIESSILNPSSGLYEFSPDFVYISYSSRKLIPKFYDLSVEDRRVFAKKFVEDVNGLAQMLKERSDCQVIISNLEPINDNIYGSISHKVDSSLYHQINKSNLLLEELCTQSLHIHLADVQSLITRVGLENAFSPQHYVNSNLAFSIDFTVSIAEQLVQMLLAFTGRINKCLILDLDNTLWGGIIGDDGIENIEIGDLGIGKAFSDLQRWVKQLKERGIILAVCSKNREEVAKEPFEKHPEMILKLEDIAVFVANWSNKADNIRYIQEVLNIGFDSMVFIDDNPVERDIVLSELPEVTVPDLPEDPAEYLPFLVRMNLFETTTYSENDSDRTRQYQEEAKRKNLSKSFTDMSTFLASLKMKGFFGPFNDFDVPRIAQLTQRSNQFNLRTIRYTESEITDIRNSETDHGFVVKLSDKFGDYGLISILIAQERNHEELFLDTWIMSCRVLERGVEHFVMNYLVERTKSLGFKWIVGEYLPTKKNMLVKNHYENLGFKREDELWYLELEKFSPFDVYIQSAES